MKTNTYINKSNMVKHPAKELFFENQIPGCKQLLTIEELAHFLNVKVKTLYGMIHREEIPFLKVGRLLRFNREQIETWLSRR